MNLGPAILKTGKHSFKSKVRDGGNMSSVRSMSAGSCEPAWWCSSRGGRRRPWARARTWGTSHQPWHQICHHHHHDNIIIYLTEHQHVPLKSIKFNKVLKLRHDDTQICHNTWDLWARGISNCNEIAECSTLDENNYLSCGFIYLLRLLSTQCYSSCKLTHKEMLKNA